MLINIFFLFSVPPYAWVYVKSGRWEEGSSSYLLGSGFTSDTYKVCDTKQVLTYLCLFPYLNDEEVEFGNF